MEKQSVACLARSPLWQTLLHCGHFTLRSYNLVKRRLAVTGLILVIGVSLQFGHDECHLLIHSRQNSIPQDVCSTGSIKGALQIGQNKSSGIESSFS